MNHQRYTFALRARSVRYRWNFEKTGGRPDKEQNLVFELVSFAYL